MNIICNLAYLWKYKFCVNQVVNAVMLTRGRCMWRSQLVITVSLRVPALLQLQCGLQAVLRSQPLGCRADSELAATKEPVGGSHLEPVITPPVWPCLYLTAQQKFP